MRSSLGTETNRERERGGHQNPKLAPRGNVGTSSLIDAAPGRVHLLYCPTLELWSWNVACIRRVKLRLSCGPAAVEEPILQRINGIEIRVARA